MADSGDTGGIPALHELLPPTPLTAGHDLSVFRCSRTTINDWLTQRALSNQERRLSMVWVVTDKQSVVWAYYALSVNMISRKAAFVRKDRPNTPVEIPVITLGKLGVDERIGGNGIGQDLLQAAIEKAVELTGNGKLSARLPVPVMLVQAADVALVPYYAKLSFVANNAEEPLMLTRSIADLEANLIAARAKEASDVAVVEAETELVAGNPCGSRE